ncbi:uncharacterized protein LOC111866999 isoform X3 [Cryptotermes secundus]|uniref:uncharacterized protein LOC111866999 isoform X3 n=1 Tax=Cryptotermes secundus TaxID=105785 RepID=UPI001454C5FF|nr:uncharacterized protein LOC111866999 isoform X3 [Cryptotermes secundus]
MNFIKLEPEPDGESYLSSFHNENQENDVAQDENLKHVGCPIMKTENDVIMDFIKSEPNSDCETCLKFSHSENEMVDVKEEEDPILITFPVVKPENEAVKSCDELEGTAEAQATVTGEQGSSRGT